MFRAGLILGLSVLLSTGCSGSESKSRLRVFAAASLTEAMTEIAQRFEHEHPGVEVELHFAGTARLFVQLAAGAQADVFAAADRHWMQRAAKAGMLASKASIVARNRLAIAVAAGNPKRIAGLRDLTQRSLRVALCGPNVPAGRYARRVISREELRLHSLSDEPSVKALIQKLRLGEIDACIVYASDVRAHEDVEAVAFDEARDVLASYPVAVMARSKATETAQRLVLYLWTLSAREVFEQRGFVLP